MVDRECLNCKHNKHAMKEDMLCECNKTCTTHYNRKICDKWGMVNMKERRCLICGTTLNIEAHHIVFRSQAPHMINIQLNKVDLCNYHHQHAPNSPHNSGNREIDLWLKKRMQDKLIKLFDREYYEAIDVMYLLGCTTNECDDILRLIIPIDGKYPREALVRRLMGGMLY